MFDRVLNTLLEQILKIKAMDKAKLFVSIRLKHPEINHSKNGLAFSRNVTQK